MMRRTARFQLLIASALMLAGIQVAYSQAGNAPGRPTAKAMAPIDLTGYWVAVISEDWRWRMVTPAKGDYVSIPLTPEGMRVTDTWDPQKDEKAGLQCKSYGAPGLMRLPGRFHITWQDENTLKLESDIGMQTRLFHFGDWKSSGGEATWQGDSIAQWQISGPKHGSLKVVTTHLRPGYLRKNGVPYDENAVMTEYFDIATEPNGDQRLLDTIVVDDPKYLQLSWITPIHYMKEADGAKWDPTPCSSTW